MINYIKGDITSVSSGLIVHGCNASGGFGSGVAGAIRRKWPSVYNAFIQCPTGESMMGKFIPVSLDEKLVVGNCYTQLHFGSDGKKYASEIAIKESLTKACEYAQKEEIDTVSLPKIGAGLGGLNWETDVVGIINELDDKFSDITFNIYYID